MAKVFVTGITGFLGSNIAKYLVKSGHKIIATYRATSSRDNCISFLNQVEWILQTNDGSWIEEVVKFTPNIVIHAAWFGVDNTNRNDLAFQLSNIIFLKETLIIAQRSNSEKFIGLGSQAEYGLINGIVSEDCLLNPTSSYSRAKIICSEIVKHFCKFHKIDWYWLRLFSFYGEGESENWLIPSFIKKILLGEEIDLTPGEQKYSYLYALDLGVAVNFIIAKKGLSGIYNISSNNLISIKELLLTIKGKINNLTILNFGKIPYRENQSMRIQGDCSKFISEFGDFEVSEFDQSINNTIEYFKAKYKNQMYES